MRRPNAVGTLVGGLALLSVLAAGDVYLSIRQLGPTLLFLLGAVSVALLAGLLYRLVMPSAMSTETRTGSTISQQLIAATMVVLAVGALYLKDMGLAPYIYLPVLGVVLVIVACRVISKRRGSPRGTEVPNARNVSPSQPRRPWYE